MNLFFTNFKHKRIKLQRTLFAKCIVESNKMVLCRISNEALLIAKRHPIHLFRNTQIFTTKDLPNEFGCEVDLFYVNIS